ncbi:LOW QUALITY PROTEIN: hypothetical protein Cgig2_022583 [Carnegiea gigantea]|uniref:Uncharacterized protein n=1 Tax=Carnegiea gigantea TaxID=171969 RepID=A0A9Q1QJM3_9CARY|nr:LOW QUALITY PROTEIN: hypothetical protein Cgig2_022583 [Carnegiea gigantea]
MSRSHQDDPRFAGAYRPALPLLFPTALGIGCHLLRSSAPGLKDRQPLPRLLSIKQKESQARHGKEKVVSEKLQLGEPIQRFPVTRLALAPLRALHRFYCPSHKLRDGPGLIVLLYVELEVAGRFPPFSRGFSKTVPNGFTLVPVRNISPTDSRRTKRRSYFQYFTLDFFSMAVMNPNLLLKQYHPKFAVSLEALWTRESETVVESRMINCYTFGGWLIHGCIRLGDYEGVPYRREERPWGRESDCSDHPAAGWRPGNSGPSAIISGTSPTGKRPFLLSTDLAGVESPSWDEELIDAPSEDECLDELSEEEEEVPQRPPRPPVLMSMGQNKDYLTYPQLTTRLET